MLRNLFAKTRQRPLVAGNARCENVQSHLLSYLDDELDTPERSLIEYHLAQCSTCRAEMAAFERAEAALGSASAMIPAPGDLRSDFYARLEQSRRTPAPIRWGFALPAVACAGLAFLLLSNLPVDQRHGAGQKVTGPRMIVRAENGPSHLQSGGDPAYDAAPEGGAAEKIAKIMFRVPKQKVAGRIHTLGTDMVASRRWRRSIALRTVMLANLSQISQRLVIGPRTKIGTEAAVRRTNLSLASDAKNEVSQNKHRELSYSYLESESAGSRGLPHEGKVVLSSLVAETELHVSDEDRDFMASTRIGTGTSHRDRRAAVQVDDDNASAQESVELQALP